MTSCYMNPADTDSCLQTCTAGPLPSESPGSHRSPPWPLRMSPSQALKHPGGPWDNLIHFSSRPLDGTLYPPMMPLLLLVSRRLGWERCTDSAQSSFLEEGLEKELVSWRRSHHKGIATPWQNHTLRLVQALSTDLVPTGPTGPSDTFHPTGKKKKKLNTGWGQRCLQHKCEALGSNLQKPSWNPASVVCAILALRLLVSLTAASLAYKVPQKWWN